MPLGDGIRRNIASVDPAERVRLRDAMLELNRRFFSDGVTWWFKQDQIHQGTHVHGGPEFLPWHRELVNRFEGLLRKVDPQLSLHYWDWTQDPRSIPGANLGQGRRGTLNLFDDLTNTSLKGLMGFGGPQQSAIGEPWASARFYVNQSPDRGDPDDEPPTYAPALPPNSVVRFVDGSPTSQSGDDGVVNSVNYRTMRVALERIHNWAHGFVNMGDAHTSFRDPFVFLLHSNVDRLFAKWQTVAGQESRLNPDLVYGDESTNLNRTISPWNGKAWEGFKPAGHDPTTLVPVEEQTQKTYKDLSIVIPPLYDTNDQGLNFNVQGFSYVGEGTLVTSSKNAYFRVAQYRNIAENLTALVTRMRAAAIAQPACVGFHVNADRNGGRYLEGALLFDAARFSGQWPPTPASVFGDNSIQPSWNSPQEPLWCGTGAPATDQASATVNMGWNTWLAFQKT